MPTDLEVAASFLSEGFCPSCGGRLRPTRSHVFRSTTVQVRDLDSVTSRGWLDPVRASVHAECFAEALCWVLWSDRRVQMLTHEDLVSDELSAKLAADVIYVAGGTSIGG